MSDRTIDRIIAGVFVAIVGAIVVIFTLGIAGAAVWAVTPL